MLRLLADIGKTTRTTSTTYNYASCLFLILVVAFLVQNWFLSILCMPISGPSPAARETTKNNFYGSFFRKSSPSLLSLLADIGKTTRTTSTTYNYASPGQHAMRDTSLLKGKQQRTTFAAAFSGKAAVLAAPSCRYRENN